MHNQHNYLGVTHDLLSRIDSASAGTRLLGGTMRSVRFGGRPARGLVGLLAVMLVGLAMAGDASAATAGWLHYETISPFPILGVSCASADVCVDSNDDVSDHGPVQEFEGPDMDNGP